LSIISSPFFVGDSVADCAASYGINVHQVKSKSIGDTVEVERLVEELKQFQSKSIKIKMVMLTHVDTSTAVLNNIQSLAAAVKSFDSSILVGVDGVW
jgi:alanine-glyoxylate transaminase/serine-glyoxylate transaminase/serine-pyruvate transaminase